VIDACTLEEPLKGHLRGALSISLDKAFPTVADSHIGPEQPIYLTLDRSTLREAILDLIRIGLDRIARFITMETRRLYR
jgi:hypothetical protein